MGAVVKRAAEPGDDILHRNTEGGDRERGGSRDSYTTVRAASGGTHIEEGEIMAGEKLQERPNGEQWQRVKQRLRAELGEDVFSSWFGRVEFEEADMKLGLPVGADPLPEVVDRVALRRPAAGALEQRTQGHRPHRADRARRHALQDAAGGGERPRSSRRRRRCAARSRR